MSSAHRIAIIQNVIPQYREDMYRRLFEHYGDRLHVYCQSSIPGMNLHLVHDKFSEHITLVRSIGLDKEKLAWQFLPVWKLFRQYDVIFFYGNPRVLSNVFWASLFRLLGKKVVIWGQYHTAGANPFMEKIRLGWWRYFDYLFLYTDREAEQYKRRFPLTKYVIGMNNGLNVSEIDAAIKVTNHKGLDAWKVEHGLADKIVILSCARLDKKNRFDFFIDCLPKLVGQYSNLVWCVIGKGDEEAELKDKARTVGVDSHIKWLGAIYKQDDLAPWFMSSRILVHPGSIGLSLLHSMGYGLPVVTHDNIAMQMPEIAALEDGFNGVLYREDNSDSLIAEIGKVLRDVALAEKLSVNSRFTAENKFNTRIMAERFMELESKVRGMAQ